MSGTRAGQPASAKKLKQACLPFKLANSPGVDGAGAKGRKRKLSGTENDQDRAENTKVELVNGGAKCFIKSDDEDASRVSQRKPFGEGGGHWAANRLLSLCSIRAYLESQNKKSAIFPSTESNCFVNCFLFSNPAVSE